jgi:hypothetical protein
MSFSIATNFGKLFFAEEMKTSITIMLSNTPQTNNSYNLTDNVTMEALAFESTSPLQDIAQFVFRCGQRFGQVSARLRGKFIAMINALDDSSVWPALAAKPDYNACIFETRRFPYFSVESKTWTTAITTATPAEYSRELTGMPSATPIPDNLAELSEDELLAIATKNNNYASYDRLTQYDKTEYIETLYAFMHMKDRPLAEYFAKFMMQSYKYFHIIYQERFWIFVKQAGCMENLKQAFWYAMYLAKQEETLIGGNITINDRVIFNLSTATAIPAAKYSLENMPFVVHVSDKKIEQQTPFYLLGNRGINSAAEFDRRFNIATGSALVGVPLARMRAAVTGSILIPCVHYSPLEIGFNRPVETNTPYKYVDDFDRYLEYYYPSYRSLSDEDYAAMCQPPTEVEREGHVADQTIELQGLVVESVYEDEGQPVKPAAVPVARPVEPDFNQLSDIDISITTRTFATFKTRVNEIYAKVVKNCQAKGAVYLVENRRIATTAYRMYGPGLIRPIDLFMIAYPPIIMVKKFHLPCVKMYYDNLRLYILSSCVSALLSGINYQYKWFSCNKVAGDIIVKYCNRGITTILNDEEIKALAEYIKISPRWSAIGTRPITGVFPQTDMFFSTEIGCRRGLREMQRYVTPTTSRLTLGPSAAAYHANRYVIQPPVLQV